jgi:hypothetical protein
MQVIPSNMQNNSDTWLSQKETEKYLDNGQIEIIGKERRNLRISQDGVLHFAVNDIVLTDSILKKMYREHIDDLYRSKLKIVSELDSSYYYKQFDRLGKEKNGSKILDSLIDRLTKRNLVNDSSLSKYAEKTGFCLGHYPKSVNNSAYDAYPIVNELVYYKQMRFRDPWYVDNIGSFLIVIERKRK